MEEEGSECRILNYKVHICSENNFPTAAGLASSAAGYACLVFALSRDVINSNLFPETFSIICRAGAEKKTANARWPKLREEDLT